MKVTILWEDQRGVVKGFAPQILLEKCIEDSLSLNLEEIRRTLQSVPKKGIGNVVKALKRDGEKLANDGPVLAVIDRDRIHDRWKRDPNPPTNCMSGIKARIASEVAASHEIIFLLDNMESLVKACCESLKRDIPRDKPTPDQRDRIVAQAAWAGPEVRQEVLTRCPSFARLVSSVCNRLS